MKYHPYPKVRRDSLSIKIILHRIDFYADSPYARMMCHHDIRTEIQSYGARIYLQHAKVYHAPKPYALIWGIIPFKKPIYIRLAEGA